MKGNFNLNIDGKSIEEIIAHSPAEHGPMLETLCVLIKALLSGTKQEHENDEMFFERKGYIEGIAAVLSLGVNRDDHAAKENMSKVGWMVQTLIEMAREEDNLKAFASATGKAILKVDALSDRSTEDKINALINDIESETGKRPNVKVVTEESLRNLPPEEREKLKEALQDMFKKL